MLDSHQRLSDVADNTVVYRNVINSYTGQGDNLSVVSVGAGDNTSGSVRFNFGAAVVSTFQNDLNASIRLNQEEFLLVVVASAQSTFVEAVAVTQDDAVASCERTDFEVRSRRSSGQLVGEIENVFDSWASTCGISACQSSNFNVVRFEVSYCLGSSICCVSFSYVCIGDSF